MFKPVLAKSNQEYIDALSEERKSAIKFLDGLKKV
jgi:hypothetical protein